MSSYRHRIAQLEDDIEAYEDTLRAWRKAHRDLGTVVKELKEDLATATDRIQADAKTIDRMHQFIAQMRAERRHLG